MSFPGSTPRAPLLWLLLPFATGLVLADRWPCPSGWLPALAFLGLGLCLLAWRASGERPAWVLAGLLAVAALAGYLRLNLDRADPAAWTRTPREVTATVTVDQLYSTAPGKRSRSGLGRITAVPPHLAELAGQRVYFSVRRRPGAEPARSGSYLVRGVLAAVPEDDDGKGFDRYLAALGYRLTLTRAELLREEAAPGRFPKFCVAAADRLEAILRTGLGGHPDLASVYLGMMLGEKAVLDAEQQNAFMRSGTFHIFSVSGLHVGVIATAIHSLLALLRVPRRPATVAAVVVLWLYVEVTGASVPALRALLMIAFVLGARILRLPGNALAALTAAALCTLLLDPRQLFATGFQLSYAVVLALVLMADPLGERWLHAWQPWRDLPPADWGGRRKLVDWLRKKAVPMMAATWVALLASTASGIGYFGLFSPGALLANLVVLPLSWLALMSGFASLVVGLGGWAAASAFLNRGAALAIAVMDWLVVRGTALPGAYFPAAFRAAWLAPAAQALVLAVILLGAALRWPRRLRAFAWPAGVVALVLIFGVKFG